MALGHFPFPHISFYSDAKSCQKTDLHVNASVNRQKHYAKFLTEKN